MVFPAHGKVKRIGIDLDNTIICYDMAFQLAAKKFKLVDDVTSLSKESIRNKIKRRENGEKQWQQIQGYVYGKGIKKAHLFPGVYRFLWRCYNRGVIIEIVSHKTEYGHFDTEKYSLRQAATQFLLENELLQNREQRNSKQLISKITFADTQQDKISYIADNNFDYFIDDLEEIVQSKHLTNVQSILFNGVNGYSWDEINNSLLKSWTEQELLHIVREVMPEKTISLLEKVEGRGNSEINKVVADDNIYIVKIYPQSGSHNRLLAEYNSLKLLEELSVPYLQIPVAYDQGLGIAIYDYIEGEKITNYGSANIKQMLSLLTILNTNKVRERFVNFNLASNACLKGSDIEVQIENRLKSFDEALDTHMELKSFINDQFIPAFNDILVWSKNNWPKNYTKNLPNSDLILSPSDFGFHNMIRTQSGDLFFYDFEYFGWDDPVKLIADVSHHAAFELSVEHERLWLNGCLDIYGQSILERYRVAWPLYGLVWCLIILNEYNKSLWERRIVANGVLKHKKERILLIQLDKAKKQLSKVLDRYDEI